MKTQTVLAQLCAIAVLVAPLGLRGATDEALVAQLGLTRFVEPEFPDVARLDGYANGQVTLAVGRNAQGEPTDILVIEASHERMAEAAVAAVRDWRFTASADPAGLKARIIRFSFRRQGVVIFPYGKNPGEEMEGDAKAATAGERVKVPQLQGLEQAPRALAQPMPAYPRALAGRRVQGSAAVSFYVDEEGRVRLPQVIEATEPEFAEAALAAVAQWRYEPPQTRGRSIVVSDNWTFQFKATN